MYHDELVDFSELNDVFPGSNDTWVGKTKDATVSGKLICDMLAQVKIDPWDFNYHSHKHERIELHEKYPHLGQTLNKPPRPSRASFDPPRMIIDKNGLKYPQPMPMTARFPESDKSWAEVVAECNREDESVAIKLHEPGEDP